MRGKYHGTRCTIYYNEDVNESALYVDSNGYPLARIENDNVPDKRTEVKYTYSSYAPMRSFTFSKGDVYKCSDPRIFTIPSDFYARCAASTTKVALTLVLSALALAVLFV